MSIRRSVALSSAVALLVLAAFVGVAAAAVPMNPQAFTEPGLKTMTLLSKINGKEYQIEIGLPYSYETSTTKTYPLFVVLDGESFFLSASEISRNESLGSQGPLNGGIAPIPEFIVVAIALPSKRCSRDAVSCCSGGRSKALKGGSM